MNAHEPDGATPAPDDLSREAEVRTDKLLERRGRALGSIRVMAEDDFAKKYRVLFQSAVSGG